MDRGHLKHELKQLIIRECDKKITPAQIDDDAVLIGSQGELELDSLDALQIALAVKREYGKRIDGSTQTRVALTSVNTLADFILADG
jgi:acyl carrier protein